MPRGKRKYLPIHLTKREKKSPTLRRKLSGCIKKVEVMGCPRSAERVDGTYNYKRCKVNPVAICRAALE